MSGEQQHCPHCDQVLAPDDAFCGWCGKPVTQQRTAPAPRRLDRLAGPPPPPPAPPPASTPRSEDPKRRPTLLIALLGGGLLLACLLVAGGGAFIWWRRGAAEPGTPVVVPATDAPVPTAPPPTEPGTPEHVESTVDPEPPASVVEDFIRATLGTVPGAAVDYDRARSLMTASYAAQFDTPAFVPFTYGIQEGPTAYDISSEEISAATATVVAVGYWGEEPGLRWTFVLTQEAGAWKVAAIESLPPSGADTTGETGPASVQPLLGEWEIAEFEGSDTGDRFRILQEPDGRLRVRWVDEYADVEGVEDLERFYLEIELEGEDRWAGEAVSIYCDAETGEIIEEEREPVVLILSDSDQQLLIGPPDSEGFISRRVADP